MHFQIVLNLLNLPRCIIFFDLNVSQNFTNYLLFIVQQDEPISLAAARRVVQLHRRLSDLVASEKHSFLVQTKVQLLGGRLVVLQTVLSHPSVVERENLIPMWILATDSFGSVLGLLLLRSEFDFTVDIHV